MFRSEIPIFLPIEHSDVVELRLDNNIIFYQTYEEGKFNLVDKFTVKGGPVITSVMGAFDMTKGLSLEKRTNRWDRRTDLMGAEFINYWE